MRKLLALIVAVTAPTLAYADGTKVAVVPFAGLTGDVPVKAGAKAATLFLGELKNTGTVTPIEVTLDPNESMQKALKEARENVAQAQELRKKRKFGQAVAAMKKAIADFDAAAPLVTDVNELSDAHVNLGTMLYLTGDDVNGAKELWSAVSLTPARELPGESTSPLFKATVKKIQEKVLSADKAQLRIDSTPANAQVMFDGQDVGRTPLSLKNIPPGKHVWQVLIPTSDPAGGVVTLASGQQQKVSGALMGSQSVSKLNRALGTNKLDTVALAELKQVATDTGADLVVFGGLAARGQDLAMETFLYSATKNAVARLPEKTFDAELLSAGMEIFKMAGDIGARSAAEIGATESLPAKLAADVTPAETAQLTEASYALPGDKVADSAEDPKKADDKGGPRRPVDPNKANKKQLRTRDR